MVTILVRALEMITKTMEAEEITAGQISGFLAMEDFLQRFGQDQGNGTYQFDNIRSGLIVGLVSLPNQTQSVFY